ncbi:MAG: hypothetical protein WB561_14400 [Terracidiphilus sp.]
MGSQKLCACDRTRQSAIGVQIEFVDTVKQPFTAIVKGLSDVSEDGLWLNPFRGIPPGPRLSRFDVIYLDENCRVLEYAENFTEAEFEPLGMVPASALILPAHTLTSIHIQRGDQFRICRNSEALAGFDDMLLQAEPDHAFQCAKNIGISASKAQVLNREEPAIKHETASSEGVDGRPSLKVRFLRWLFPESAPIDRRRGERLRVPGLVAYYWTGGAPQAYQLGNVSGSGLYLLTEERWLPGTRIVMTLQTEKRESNTEDIVRVESKVIRWGEEGVGCEFVESGYVDLNTGETIEDQRFDRAAFEQFLRRSRGLAPRTPQTTIQ